MTTSVAKGAASWSRVDTALALLLFAGVFAYLATLPLNLSVPDEPHALLAAKRVGAGEALYRDVFDLVMPGWPYFMAVVFRCFGCTLATARLTIAVIHGATAVSMFAACRWLGVRRGLAWAAGLAYLVVCQPMLPAASYHWLVTCLAVATLLVCLRCGETVASAFALGVLAGLAIVVHQNRGVIGALGIAALIVALSMLHWRYGGRLEIAATLRRLALFAGGAAMIIVPILLLAVTAAGFRYVWDAIVVFPLVTYRTAHHAVPYGLQFGLVDGTTTRTAYFRYLPLAGVLSVAGLLPLVWRAEARERARGLLILVLLGGFAMLSIMYYPDVIHIALVAPIFIVALAEGLERALGQLPARLGHGLGLTVAAAVVLGGAVHLAGRAVALHRGFPVPYDSAFGRVDLPSARQKLLWEQLRQVVDATPGRTLYMYPYANYVPLLVDAQNATRFALILPSSTYSPQEHIQEVIDTLAAKHVTYVVATPNIATAEDPIARYVRAHYARIAEPRPLADILWKRKDEGAH